MLVFHLRCLYRISESLRNGIFGNDMFMFIISGYNINFIFFVSLKF